MTGASVVESVAVTSSFSVVLDSVVLELPADLLRPAHTVRVFVACVLGTLPNSRQILICGPCPRQQFLHVGGGVGHLVEDKRQRRRVPDPGAGPDLGSQGSLGAF